MPSLRGAEFDTVAAGPRGGLREAILGLLAIRPMSGYDISRFYARALQRVWYAPKGQIYPTLRSMLADGLLAVEMQVQESRPNRKEYRLTEDGREALLGWLHDPAARPFMHHEFIGKLFLLDNLPAAERRPFVEDYIERCSAWGRELRIIEEKITPATEGPFAESASFQLMSLRHLRRLVECETRSARHVLEELGAAEASGEPTKPALGAPAPDGLVDLFSGREDGT